MPNLYPSQPPKVLPCLPPASKLPPEHAFSNILILVFAFFGIYGSV